MPSRPSWAEFQASLSKDERWSHCGRKSPHTPHRHTFSMNEGPYTVPCVGTPRLRADNDAVSPSPSASRAPTPRPSWDEYFLSLVDAAAARASCDRGRSGAVFVRDRDVLATGYVGAPPGLSDCYEVGHQLQTVVGVDSAGRPYRTEKTHCVRTIHAEQNGIIRAARNGVSLRGATIYCTMEPCVSCAMSLIGLEVPRVVAKNAYHGAQRSRDMFAQVGVTLEVLSGARLYDASLPPPPSSPPTPEATCCSAYLRTGSVHTNTCYSLRTPKERKS